VVAAHAALLDVRDSRFLLARPGESRTIIDFESANDRADVTFWPSDAAEP